MFKKFFAIPVLFAALVFPQLEAADYSLEIKGDRVPLSSKNITLENGALKIDKNSFARVMCELPAEQGSFTCEAVFELLPMPAGVARHTSQVVSFVNKADRRTNADFVINQYARDKRPFFVFMIRQTDGKFLSVGEFYQITPGQKTVICAKWDKEKLALFADGKLLKTVPRKLPFLNDTGKMVINKVGDRYPTPMKLSRIAIAGSDPAIAAPMTYADKKAATLAESKAYKYTYTELPCSESIKNIPAANGMLEFEKGKYLRCDSSFPGDEGAFIFEAELDLQPMDQNLPRRTSQLVSISDKGRTIADFVINQYPKNEQPYFVFMLRQSDGKYFSVGEFGDIVPGEKTIVCASWNKKNVKLAVNGKVLKTVPVKTDFIGGKGYMIVGNPYKSGRVSVPMKVSQLTVLGAKPVSAGEQKKKLIYKQETVSAVKEFKYIETVLNKIPEDSAGVSLSAGSLRFTENGFCELSSGFPTDTGTLTFKASFDPIPLNGADRRINPILAFVGETDNVAELVINQYARHKNPYFIFMIRQNNGKFINAAGFHEIKPGKDVTVCARWDKENISISVDGKCLKSVPRKLPFMGNVSSLIIGKERGKKYNTMPMTVKSLTLTGTPEPAEKDKRDDADFAEYPYVKHQIISELSAVPVKFDTEKTVLKAAELSSEAGSVEMVFVPEFKTIGKNDKRIINSLFSFSGNSRTVAGLCLNQYPDGRKLINFTAAARDGKSSVCEADYPFESGRKYSVVIYWNRDEITMAVNGKAVKKVKRSSLFSPAAALRIGKSMYRSLPMKVEKFVVRGTPAEYPDNVVYPAKSSSWISNSPALTVENLPDDRLKIVYSGGNYAKLSAVSAVYPAAGRNHIRASGRYIVEKSEYGSMMMLMINNRFQSPIQVMSGNRYHRPLSQFKNADTPDRFDFSVPSQPGEAYTFSILFYGNPCTVILDKVNVRSEFIKREGRPVPTPENRKFDSRKVDKALAEKAPLKPEIRRAAGRTQLYIDGKLQNPVIYKRGPHYPHWTRYKEFADAGIDHYLVSASLGKTSEAHKMSIGGIWTDKDKYDFSKLRSELRTIYAINPNAKVMLALCCGPYENWAKDFPDAVFTNAAGEKGKGLTTAKVVYYGKRAYEEAAKRPNEEFFDVPSNYSAEYKREVSKAAAAVAKFLSGDPSGKIVYAVKVVGGADGQYFPFDRDVTRGEDHSPAAKRAWSNYLRARYGNDTAKLRAAWGEKDASFDNARIPGVTERGQDNSGVQPGVCGRDYMLFISDALADLRLSIFKAIKENSGSRLLTGCYYPPGTAGNMHVEKMINSPYTDFLVDIRRITPAGSYIARNKLYVAELDMRVPDIMTPIWNYTFDKTTFRSIARDAAANAVLRERGMCYFYDIGECYYANPETIRFYGSLQKAFADAVDSTLNVAPEIGVFRDYAAMAGYSYREASHLVQCVTSAKHHALDRSGVPYQAYIAQDILKKDFKLPKVIFFPLVPDFTPEEIADLRARAKAANSTIIWGFYRPFREGERSDVGGIIYNYPARKVLAQSVATGSSFTAGSAGKIIGESYSGFTYTGSFQMLYERPAVITVAPGDEVLARYSDGSGASMILRRCNGLTEIICGAPGAFDPALLRNIARSAGAQVLSENDNISVAAADGILSVFCDRGGDIVVRIPAGFKVVSSLTGKKYSVAADKLNFRAFDGESVWFKLAAANVPLR